MGDRSDRFVLAGGLMLRVGESEGVERAEALQLYRSMLTIRQFEEAAGTLLAAGRVPGFIHLSIGQEAVAVGVCSQLTERDHITSTHRGHGHCIAKGGQLNRMMAELFGKAEGYCRGRSGSMHIADPAVGILGANAIVGGGIAMAVGAALSAQLRRDGTVAVTFFGEGAVAEGVFHESLNLAALWQLPAVFVCENNQYAEMTHVSAHLSSSRVADFGAPYGVSASTWDGNDVLQVRDATAKAIDRARAGEGPTLLEFETYRWRGHFEGDQQAYRSAEEVADWKRKDPLRRLSAHMCERLDVSDHALSRLREEVEREIAEAIAWAEGLPDPEPSLLTEDVYRSLRYKPGDARG